MDWLLSQTSLPNLHPALVHFPIALLATAVLVETLGLFARSRDWREGASTFLYALSLISAYVALRAGETAADSLGDVGAKVQPLIAEHSDWAHWTLWAILVVATGRIALAWWDRERKRVWLRGITLVLGLVALGLVVRTADLGGTLVYRHGLGMARLEESSTQASTTEPAAKVEPDESTPSIDELEDGTIRWTPEGSDAAETLTVLVGSPELTAVNGVLEIAVSGRTMLALPGTFGDVQVSAELDVAELEGTVGLFHHASDANSMSLFELEPAGEALLLEIRDGNTKEISRENVDLGSGQQRLLVSAAGRHLKGLLGEATVVHGHEAPGPDGRVGLLLDGSGTVRLRGLEAVPLSS